MVAIFPKLCLWRRSLCSNLGGIDLEKLYRATLILQAATLPPPPPHHPGGARHIATAHIVRVLGTNTEFKDGGAFLASSKGLL